MKKLILASIVLFFCFVIPLHLYSIGGDQGVGIQGAFYRFQVTGYGPMMITMTQDMFYVISGIYSGRTAFSIVFWVIGNIFLVIATLIILIRSDNLTQHYQKQSGFLLIGAGIFYVVSCIAQFGPFLNGSAGISMPFGGFTLILLGIVMMIYPSLNYTPFKKA